MKQYFSKLHNEWKDFTSWDCEDSLKKYGYQIRENYTINTKVDEKGKKINPKVKIQDLNHHKNS